MAAKDFGDLERIEFGRGEDDRVILVGSNLPIRFGRVSSVEFVGDSLHFTIKRDILLEHREKLRQKAWEGFKAWIKGN